MKVETNFGVFEVVKNYKDAFDIVKFNERYIEEVYDKYQYLVGDISSGILRLKGFDTNPNSKNYYHFIADYMIESCTYNCSYYILKREKKA